MPTSISEIAAPTRRSSTRTRTRVRSTPVALDPYADSALDPTPPPPPPTPATVRLDSEYYGPGITVPSAEAQRDSHGRFIRSSDAVTVSGRTFHRLDEAVCECPACHSHVLDDDMSAVVVNERGGTQNICHNCRGQSTWMCDDCDRTFLTTAVPRPARSSSYGTICPTCRRNRNPASESDMYGRILNYSDRRVGGLPSADRSSMIYGLEVECCVVGGPRADEAVRELAQLTGEGYYVTKHDGSLDNGFEIVTRPDSMAVHRQEWGKIFKAIGGSDLLRNHLRSWLSPRQCCGIHCHIDKSQLSPLELGKLLVWLNHPDNRDFIIKVAGRGPNSYTSFDASARVVDGITLKTSRSQSRYTALNVGASTAEIRIFRGTLFPAAFAKNLDFVEASVEWTGLASGCPAHNIRVPAFIDFVSARKHRFPALWGHIVQWGLNNTTRQ